MPLGNLNLSFHWAVLLAALACCALVGAAAGAYLWHLRLTRWMNRNRSRHLQRLAAFVNRSDTPVVYVGPDGNPIARGIPVSGEKRPRKNRV